MVPAVALLSSSKHPCPNASQTLLSPKHNLSPGALPVPLHLRQLASGRGHGASSALITVSICSSFGPGVLQQQTPQRMSRAWRSELKAGVRPVGTGSSTCPYFTTSLTPALVMQPKASTWTVAHSHLPATKAGQKGGSKPQT